MSDLSRPVEMANWISAWELEYPHRPDLLVNKFRKVLAEQTANLEAYKGNAPKGYNSALILLGRALRRHERTLPAYVRAQDERNRIKKEAQAREYAEMLARVKARGA